MVRITPHLQAMERAFGRQTTRSLGDLPTIVINHLYTTWDDPPSRGNESADMDDTATESMPLLNCPVRSTRMIMLFGPIKNPFQGAIVFEYQSY